MIVLSSFLFHQNFSFSSVESSCSTHGNSDDLLVDVFVKLLFSFIYSTASALASAISYFLLEDFNDLLVDVFFASSTASTTFFSLEDFDVLVFFFSLDLLDVDDFLPSSIASAMACAISDFFEDDFDVLVFFFSLDLLVELVFFASSIPSATASMTSFFELICSSLSSTSLLVFLPSFLSSWMICLYFSLI